MPIHLYPQNSSSNKNSEPYIRLPAPHTDIILTPPRPNDPKDASFLVTTLNDPRVYTFLESPPFPYLPEHAASFIRDARAECDRILKDVDAGRVSVDGCPFRFIRQVVKKDEDEDGEGTDVLIGDISITRYAFYELPPGSEERREAQERNKALPVGSRDIVWGIGNFLSPSHYGRGIMTAVVRTLIDEWAVPRMNARLIKASAYVGNVASVRVFEKNGFEMERTLEDWSIVPESRGGGRKSIHVLGLRAP